MTIYLSKGTTLSIDKDSGNGATGGTFTNLGQVTSIDPPSGTVDKVEKTNLDSTRHEYRPGLPDTGGLAFEIQFDPGDTDHAFLRAAAGAAVTYDFQVGYPTLPKATLDTFTGLLTEFAPKTGGAGDNLTASVKVAVVSGVATTTAA